MVKPGVLVVNEAIQIPDDEFRWTFVRSGGPGGQNVNKVASRAVLRWNVAASPSLPEDVRSRFRSQQHRRITSDGDLILSCQRSRDQGRNIDECLTKLRDLLRLAATPPRPRKPTRPTRGSKQRRIQAKRRRTAIKQTRRRPAED